MPMLMSIAMPEFRDACGPSRALDLGSASSASLVLEEVDRVAGVMPEQVVRPASRLAFGVDVSAPEEVGLHVHLLDVEFAGLYPLPDPLMAWIEPPGVPRHGHKPRLFLDPDQPLGVGQRIGHGDFHLHVLAGAHALLCLVRVHLRGRGEDRGFDTRLLEALGQVRGPVGDAVLPGDRFGRIRRATGEGDDFDAVYAGQPGQVLLAKGALARYTDLHQRYSLSAGSFPHRLQPATGKIVNGVLQTSRSACASPVVALYSCGSTRP